MGWPVNEPPESLSKSSMMNKAFASQGTRAQATCPAFIKFFALLMLLPGGLFSRGPGVLYEHVPNSARLELAAVRQVVLPEGASENLVAAVGDLQVVWDERVPGSAGLKLATGAPRKFSIVLEYRDVPAWARLWRPWPAGSFTISRERSRVYIRAAGDAGLLNGVYALCHEVLGARWYWAGDLGKAYVGEVPRFFPERFGSRSPAFVQRRMYPMNNDFGRRNRLVGGYSFNHNMARVFTPAVYATDPEIFPVVRGVKKIPKGSGAYDAMPDLLHPRAVEIAAEAALEHFAANPESVSFSLSINDNTNFDGQAQTREFFGEMEFYRRRPNFSDYVFRFMNAVAKQVFDEGGAWKTPDGEDRYLTALAYYWTEQSPGFKLHPRVMPVLTSDRAQWHDPNYRLDDLALIKRWSRSGAKRIATWDYYFGSPYPYPRQFNKWIAESLKHLAKNKVTVFYSQLPSAWGLDGGKAWLASRLLWDPYQDAEELLDEYYTTFFGPAAETMRTFYETAEAHRNAHEGEWCWIKHYLDEAAIELFPPTVLREMRASIEAGRARVPADSVYAKRMAVVSEAFGFTEQYAAYQTARRELVDATLAESPSLAGKIGTFLKARLSFEGYAEDLLQDPMHARLEYFMRLNQSDPVPMALGVVARLGASLDGLDLGDYAANLEVATRWAEHPETFEKVFWNEDLRHQFGMTRARTFYEPSIPKIYDWSLGLRAAEHLRIAPASENAGLLITHADYVNLYSEVRLKNTRDYVIEFEIEARNSPDNRTFVQAIWRDADKKKIRNDKLLQLPNDAAGRSYRFFIPVRSPEAAAFLQIRLKTERQYPGDYLKVVRAQVHAALKDSAAEAQ